MFINRETDLESCERAVARKVLIVRHSVLCNPRPLDLCKDRDIQGHIGLYRARIIENQQEKI